VLRIRYNTDPDFCEFLHFVGNLDEELAAIDRLLSEPKLLKLIESDLSQRYPNTTQTGRNSTLFRGDCTDVGSQALTLCAATLRRLKPSTRVLSYDSFVEFILIHFRIRVPCCGGLISFKSKLKEQFNQQLTSYATQLQITQGKIQEDRWNCGGN
jgi:IS5 family transposase